jgi:hypothetical protein
MRTYQIQVSSLAKQTYKEIQFHLFDGKVLNLPLLDAEMIDMGNGHVIIIGNVLEHDGTTLPISSENSIEASFWKQ